jgi:hypothetical protein
MNDNENVSAQSIPDTCINEGQYLRSIDNTNAPFSDTEENEDQNSKYKEKLLDGLANEFNEKIGRGIQKDKEAPEKLKEEIAPAPNEKSSGNIKERKNDKYIVKEHWTDEQKDLER